MIEHDNQQQMLILIQLRIFKNYYFLMYFMMLEKKMDIRHCATKFDSVFNVCAEEKEKDFLLLAYLYLVGNE